MADVDIREVPVAPNYVRFREGFGPRFLVTVDTEEEFDWDAPIDPDRHSITSVPALRKFQQFCEGFGVRPIYLVDQPVADAAGAVDALGDAIKAGRAEIGVHLHPWLSPPYSEDISEFNSFAGNLPAELERAKFKSLRGSIERNFGIAPLISRSGRYGAGPNTAKILIDSGIAVDTSVRAQFDYSSDGGPNFREHPLRPYWLDRAGGLLEMPLTTVYWGALGKLGRWIYPRLWRIPQLRGLLAKTGMLDRIPLTPEGVSAEEAMRGIDAAIADRLPLLVFSFHSPSLAPGNTPYVGNHDELDRFYDWWRTVFGYLRQCGIESAGVGDIMAAVELA